MKYIILLIVASLLSLEGYSQSSVDMNNGLLTGLKCCEMNANAQQQILFLDSLQVTQQEQIGIKDNQLFLLQANVELSELRENSLLEQIGKCSSQLAKEEKRKRTWRTVFFISTGLLAGYYGYNQLK